MAEAELRYWNGRGKGEAIRWALAVVAMPWLLHAPSTIAAVPIPKPDPPAVRLRSGGATVLCTKLIHQHDSSISENLSLEASSRSPGSHDEVE